MSNLGFQFLDLEFQILYPMRFLRQPFYKTGRDFRRIRFSSPGVKSAKSGKNKGISQLGIKSVQPY
jgi:hypothetical protein